MNMQLSFLYKKATQVLNYFAQREGGTIDKLKAIKLIYFADRFHLRKYGRLITNDEYYAMEYGPVGSGLKDIADQSDFLSSEELGYSANYIEPQKGHMLRSVSDVDEDVFSETDIEALNFSWLKFGSMDRFKLAEVTHNYPEWKNHEASLKLNTRIRMNIIDFFEEPPPGFEKCFDLSEEEKNDLIEQLKEYAMIESEWSS